ncbi:MAG: Gfo/Idh/MocA family oxidoreductase [Acidimicrobiia bacterium]|nr:Gfo/Idh/MocA family oxidoreductase [Acidimicrobiia bacterium]
MTRLMVVGLGRQGHRHVRAAGQLPDVDVVATVDPVSSPVDPIPNFGSVDEALDRLRVDAAIVATPSSLHAAVGRQLLEAGVPTLIEKPIAGTVEEARDLVKLAEARSVLLATGHVERFNPAVRLVHGLLAQGRLGRPVAFSFRRVGLPPPSPVDVSVVHDLAVHDIDVLALLAGAAPELAGASGWPATGPIESAHILLLAGGTQGLVEVNWKTPVRLRHFTITTETLYVEANYTTQRVELIEASDPAEFVGFEEFQSHYGSARRVQLEARPAEPLVLELTEFVAAVRGEGLGALATGADGLRALEIAEEAVERIRSG